jgi:tungstate transport system ATP-binding protein
MSGNPIFELRGVQQRYGDRTALEIPSLVVPEGCILGVAGHNGSGKSTLMRLLAFLERPFQGEVLFRDRAVTDSGVRQRREVTLLTQEPYLLLRSVAANVGYGLKVRGNLDADQVRTRVREALAMVGLEPDVFEHRSWRELSGGEAQRVALAARLVLRPQVLLMDEPTSSLDPENAERLLGAAVLARREWGATLVVVSHDAAWLESVSDGVLRIVQGRIASAPDFCRSRE